MRLCVCVCVCVLWWRSLESHVQHVQKTCRSPDICYPAVSAGWAPNSDTHTHTHTHTHRSVRSDEFCAASGQKFLWFCVTANTRWSSREFDPRFVNGQIYYIICSLTMSQNFIHTFIYIYFLFSKSFSWIFIEGFLMSVLLVNVRTFINITLIRPILYINIWILLCHTAALVWCRWSCEAPVAVHAFIDDSCVCVCVCVCESSLLHLHSSCTVITGDYSNRECLGTFKHYISVCAREHTLSKMWICENDDSVHMHITGAILGLSF